MAPPLVILRALELHGNASPCAKSKRAVVVYDPVSLRIHGVGFNTPPEPFTCDASEACRASCGRTCIHAEQMAITDAVGCCARMQLAGPLLLGLELVHGKFVNGELVGGGGPSCWQCSRLVLEHEIRGVWLYEGVPVAEAARVAVQTNLPPYHPPVWRFYTALEFHQATLKACGLYSPTR